MYAYQAYINYILEDQRFYNETIVYNSIRPCESRRFMVSWANIYGISIEKYEFISSIRRKLINQINYD